MCKANISSSAEQQLTRQNHMLMAYGVTQRAHSEILRSLAPDHPAWKRIEAMDELLKRLAKGD